MIDLGLTDLGRRIAEDRVAREKFLEEQERLCNEQMTEAERAELARRRLTLMGTRVSTASTVPVPPRVLPLPLSPPRPGSRFVQWQEEKRRRKSRRRRSAGADLSLAARIDDDDGGELNFGET
jgi:hypothetical protein